MIVAFAGTDPVSLANWISDFDAHLDEKSGIANGYRVAAEVVWPDVKRLPRQGKFDKANLAPDVNSDQPPFDQAFVNTLRDHLREPFSAAIAAVERVKLAMALQVGAKIPNIRTDPGGIAIELLPPRLRDHMPDRYISACNG